ncbi:uncharacterized protein [Misgurnus anguillicaudatus]|uniref:uncharacterized protein n=1 Tax=Misgurnus anguillicaudatus TaxID=75329 RepID=UPI003CCF659A
MRKNNHFLNMMTPSSHIFLMRNILHHNNIYKNSRTIENMKTRLGMGVDIALNSNGQTVLASTKAAAIRTPQADGPGEAEALVHGDLLGCSLVCCGLTHLEHIGARSAILDSQLDDVLDHKKSATELVGELCTHNLTRWDFQTLGSKEELDARIVNCCLELICEIAKEEGKDICAVDADADAVATWHPPHVQDPFLILPDNAASKDCILFPVWKPGHWFLSVLLPKRFWIYQLDSASVNGYGDINYVNMFMLNF